MKCEKRPNGNCPHAHKDFETLKKDFPYFSDCKYRNLSTLQSAVCDLCKTEWHIPRFKGNF